MAPKLLVLGHANIDVILRVDRLPSTGESRPVQDRQTVYGGTACNIARHAANLGCPAKLWARVGDDFPIDWRTQLLAEGVELALELGNRTPTCYIFTDAEGHQSYCMDQGAMADMDAHPPNISLLDGITHLHVATGQPASYVVIMQAAKAQGLHIGFDPGQEIHFAYDAKSFEQLLNLSDTLFLNAVELEVALRFMRYGDPVQFLDHVSHVILTRGDEGAQLIGPGGGHVAAQSVPVVDPTGAGDALRGGYYAALLAGSTALDALRYGSRAAAFQVQHSGPQNVLPSPLDLL